MVDASDLELRAVDLYRIHQLDPSTPESTFKLIRLEIGAVVRADMAGREEATFPHGGERLVALRRGLPLPYAVFWAGHGLAHVLLEREGLQGEELERACDYLGAALIAPRPAMHRLFNEYGFDLGAIAAIARSTQTWVTLRIGEVERVPVVAISPHAVRARGPEEWVWPDERTLRSWGRTGRPGLRKVIITDGGRGRFALVANEED